MEEEKVSKGGIVLPETAEKEKPIKGKVLAIGPGKKNDKGEIQPMSVKVGDMVLFKKYGPDEVELEGKKYLVGDEDDILANTSNNTMAKQIKFNEDARAAIKKGIDKLAEAVTMTLGPRGRAVVIEKGYGAPQVTFDGVTVAKEIEFEDKWENVGAEFHQAGGG